MTNTVEHIKRLLDQLPEGESSKVVIDQESNIIRIYPENLSAISRASSGLNELLELSYTTAEHHPYWNILYHCSEISKMVLDAWEAKLTREQLEEIKWRNQEMQATVERIIEHHT